MPDFYVDDVEKLINVVRTQVDVVLPDGVAVLNAGDDRVAELASLCDGDVMFFGLQADLPRLQAHRQQDGRSVYVRDGQLIMAVGAEESAICRMADIPMAAGGVNGERHAAILAAVGAAWALGLPADLIRTGLETFDNGLAAAK